MFFLNRYQMRFKPKGNPVYGGHPSPHRLLTLSFDGRNSCRNSTARRPLPAIAFALFEILKLLSFSPRKVTQRRRRGRRIQDGATRHRLRSLTPASPFACAPIARETQIVARVSLTLPLLLFEI